MVLLRLRRVLGIQINRSCTSHLLFELRLVLIVFLLFGLPGKCLDLTVIWLLLDGLKQIEINSVNPVHVSR